MKTIDFNDGLEKKESSKTFDKYEVGETIIYQNGENFELGIVKKDCGNNEYFINYHMGDTAARTHARNMHKILNIYAFKVYRLDFEGNEINKSKAIIENNGDEKLDFDE